MSRKIQKQHVDKNNVVSIPVMFDGGLLSSTRAQMINELLKYFLFERQQMPMPFDLVKREVERDEQSQCKKKGRMQFKIETRKAKDLIKKLQDIFVHVIQAFEVCPEIPKVAVVLGATAVTPKETFVIEMPPLSPDADNLAPRSCIQSLFRQLILQDPLGGVKQISPTSVMLLLCAPRDSSLAWFLPKPAYRLRDRGKRFCFKLQNNCAVSKHDLSHDYAIVDLSGFETLDTTAEEASILSAGGSYASLSGECDTSLSSDYVCTTSENLVEMGEEWNKSGSCNTTPTNCSELSSHTFNRAPTDTGRSGRTFKKSSSTSSILSQASVISQASDTLNKTNELLSGIAQSTCDSKHSNEYIWFQAPNPIKGYRSKISS